MRHERPTPAPKDDVDAIAIDAIGQAMLREYPPCGEPGAVCTRPGHGMMLIRSSRRCDLRGQQAADRIMRLLLGTKVQA